MSQFIIRLAWSVEFAKKKKWKYFKICTSKFILFKVSYVIITLHDTVVKLVVSGKGEIKTTVVELARNIKPFDFEFASSN